jgi:hypothetical protein
MRFIAQSMFIQSDDGQKPENIFVRLLSVVAYILVPIGTFLFPPFVFTLLIYHKQMVMMGILEFLFLIVPILFVTLVKPKHTNESMIIIRLFILGLFIFAIFFAVIFMKVLPAFFGAMG